MPLNIACNPQPAGKQAAIEERQQAEDACSAVLERHYSEIIAALRLATRHGLPAADCETITAEINGALEARRQAVVTTLKPR